MFAKWMKLAVALVILVAALTVVSAQLDENLVDYCAIVAEQDCQILVMNEITMNSVSSFSADFEFAIDLVVEDGADEASARAEASSLDMVGTMSISIDPDVLSKWTNLEADMSYETMAALLEEFVSSLTGEMSVTIRDASGDEPSEIEIVALMKDGVYVLEVATLEAMTGESMGELEWLGIDTSGISEMLLEEAELDTSFRSMQVYSAMDEIGLEQHLTVERLPDTEIMGSPAAVFDLSFDLASLLSSPEIQAFILSDQMDAEVSGSEFEAIIDMMGLTQMSVREYIGLADFYTYRGDVTLSSNYDGEYGSFQLTMLARVEMRDHNMPVDVAIPEDAFVLPLSMLNMLGS